MAVLIIILLIVLYGYFSLAEIALISVTEADLSEEKYKLDPRSKIVLGLIRSPEEFLSAVQVGMTLVGMLEGIYGGTLLAQALQNELTNLGFSELTARITSLIAGIGFITYLTIVLGELVPKTIALQMPMKISLAIAPSLHVFSKVTYPVIKLLTLSTRFIVSLLGIKNKNSKKISENDLKKMLSMAYQQGVFSKQQLWLHENLFTFEDLTAKRIMKPAKIVMAIPDHWDRNQVKQFIKKRPYSYFPVYKATESNIIGIIKAKAFLLDDNADWVKNLVHTCYIDAQMPAKDIFTSFKEKNMDFGIVIDESKKYIGVVAMQDIMEGVFGDIPELEDYSSYFYRDTDKVWIAEGFIHLQRIRMDLNLPWLREYESEYLSLSELMNGEIEDPLNESTLTINNVVFRIIHSVKTGNEQISITLP